jgi:uncharacterized delta-60 repeat protein
MKRLSLPVPACMLALVLAAAFLTGCGSASALFDSIEKLFFPPGSLDESFGGGDGIVITDVGTSLDEAYAVAVQSDGKIVVAGRNAWDFAVLRYTSEGVLDSDFGGGDGIVTTDLGGTDIAYAVTIQTDNKIVVVGTVSGGTSDIGIVRYTSSGALDPLFSGDGIAMASPGTNDQGRAVAIQSDGMIVVAGSSDGDFVVLRYDDANGAPDNLFGTAGVVRTNIGSGDSANSVAIQPADQKIIAAGQTGFGASSAFVAIRYLADGTLDTLFGTGGIATADFAGSADEVANSVVLQSDRKIVLGGLSATSQRFALVRLNDDGSLDTSFGDSGFVATACEITSVGKAVALQTDGRIALAGFAGNGINFKAAAIRYMPDGTLDASFGICLFSNPVDLRGNAIAIQGDGRIIIAGSQGPARDQVALLRILP